MNGLPKLISGSQPIDNGQYIFSSEEARSEFLSAEPRAEPFIRPYVSGLDYLRNRHRWILALRDAPPNVLAGMPQVRARIARVREFRSRSKRKQTLQLAHYPTRYNVEVIPTAPFLVIPKVSSERREYVPVGWLEPPTIPSDLIFVLQDATLTDFALLTSAMHMAWLRHIGGRLKSDYRYSIGLVYNTFPKPPANPAVSKLDLWQRPFSTRAPPILTPPCGPLRPGSDAARPPPRPPRDRPRRGPALSPDGVRLGTRARRASVHALREDARTLGIGIKKPKRRRR